jgi:hypothetical protein
MRQDVKDVIERLAVKGIKPISAYYKNQFGGYYSVFSALNWSGYDEKLKGLVNDAGYVLSGCIRTGGGFKLKHNAKSIFDVKVKI